RLGQQLRVKPPHELEIKVHLHVEIVQAEVTEVAIEEGVVGDLVKCFRARIFEAIVVPESVAQEAAFTQQLALEAGARIGLRAAKVERVLVVTLHEPQVDENLLQRSVRFEHQQVVRDVDVELVQYPQRIEDVLDRLLAVEVTKTVFGGVLNPEENAE